MRSSSARTRGLVGAALAAVLCLGLAMSQPSPARAKTIHIVVGATEPSFVVMPGTQVYYTTSGGYRVYRYDGSYYVYQNGVWYQSPSVAGDYTVVRTTVVPASLVRARTVRTTTTVHRHRHHHRVVVKQKVKTTTY